MQNLFNHLEKPSADLFYRRNDKNDPRLGEIVKSEISDYNEAEIVIIGSPQDKGVERNKGRTGAVKAPDKIREAFYKLVANKRINSQKIFDAGNIKTNVELEEIHKHQEEVIYSFLNDGKIVLVLGGGNDISYPDCKALSRYKKDLLAINIDSHFDVRDNGIRNSGTPYRMLLDEKIISPEKFFEVGIKEFASSGSHKEYLDEQGVKIFYNKEVKETGIKKILDKILSAKCESVFWGFDMDVINSADAPGVSAPNPVGLSAEEAVRVAEFAGLERRTGIFEISEVNPEYDIDNRTSKLAALMLWHFLNSLS